MFQLFSIGPLIGLTLAPARDVEAIIRPPELARHPVPPTESELPGGAMVVLAESMGELILIDLTRGGIAVVNQDIVDLAGDVLGEVPLFHYRSFLSARPIAMVRPSRLQKLSFLEQAATPTASGSSPSTLDLIDG